MIITTLSNVYKRGVPASEVSSDLLSEVSPLRSLLFFTLHEHLRLPQIFCLPFPTPLYILIAETTVADPGPMQRLVAVGFRFCPTEEEIVAYYLRHKLMADDPSIYTTIPEIDVCKYEPCDLLAWATSAALATKFDDSECFFFSPRDYKYANSTRWNRATSRGFWKVTGRDRKITDQGTNNVIGRKKILVFHEGRFPRGRKTNWIIHEYHDAILPPDQRNFVLCKLTKRYEKKTKEKAINIEQELIELERELNNDIDFEHEIQANFNMISEENYLSNTSSTIQTSTNEAIDIDNTGIQTQPYSNEDIESMIHELLQSNESIPPKLTSSSETPLFDYEELCSNLAV